MNLIVRPLQKNDLKQASDLDKKWFVNYGISEEELNNFIDQNPNNSLVILNNDLVEGFATFEILDSKMPKDYIGNITSNNKILFIQQFTTSTNYKIGDWGFDEILLSEIEKKAKEFNCNEIWEALAIDHPYSKNKNPEFDAFGFYKSQGFVVDANNKLSWEPNNEVSIKCFLFRKNIV